MIDEAIRGQVVAQTERLYRDLCPCPDDPFWRARSCTYWALAAAHALDALGYPACINAGSARFLAEIDGPERVYYEYAWQDWPAARLRDHLAAHGTLPEVHAWAVVPSLGLLIDPTVVFLPELARGCGLEWNRPVPTDWLWATSMPDDWDYTPSDRATRFVYWLMEAKIKLALDT